DFLSVRIVRPRSVHRMALREGLPPEGRTLCVIACLLTDEKSGSSLAALLERYRLANRDSGDQLLFGLLADLPDSKAPMGSAGWKWVSAAREAVNALNQTYGGGFYLLFRRPEYEANEESYRGWERKRGALLELSRLLKGRRTRLKVLAGDSAALKGVRYVITLDSDTALNVGTARELVGAMLHPLNRAHVDPRSRVVTEGYGLLQPRVGVDLEAANRSHFARIFAGQGGVDPYGSASSDVFHDLFDRATYTGKGIFDVDAFFACLDGRFPQNRVLSHDLLEGAYLRAGLAGDVELTDGYPYKVTSYFNRLHRWVRGDWQILPWLGRTVRLENGTKERNPITDADKYKIFDNLRRSLSPICTLIALFLGMCMDGPVFAAAATAAILSAWSNLLLSGADLAFRGGRGLRERYHSTIIAGPGGMILQTLVQLLFLPCQAVTCLSAISVSLWRQLVAHRGMLEWTTAAESDKKVRNGILANYRRLWPAALVGVLATVFATLPAGSAVGLLWALSPLFAWSMSRPIAPARAASPADAPFLLHEGALIWRFFSDFLRPEDHWLPPDNWQEEPNPTLARRTSPTNIGL
ncbi:MAG: glycosyl transferase, partial [Clostridiales bacterium]|nr:glycosyl transferase [Clostridiales bacterium]